MAKISIMLVQLISIPETKTSMLPGAQKGRLNVRDFRNIPLKVILFMLCMSLWFHCSCELLYVVYSLHLTVTYVYIYVMGIWKSRKWKWNGSWKWKLEMETGNGNQKLKTEMEMQLLRCCSPSKIYLLLWMLSQCSPCLQLLLCLA